MERGEILTTLVALQLAAIPAWLKQIAEGIAPQPLAFPPGYSDNLLAGGGEKRSSATGEYRDAGSAGPRSRKSARGRDGICLPLKTSVQSPAVVVEYIIEITYRRVSFPPPPRQISYALKKRIEHMQKSAKNSKSIVRPWGVKNYSLFPLDILPSYRLRPPSSVF